MWHRSSLNSLWLHVKNIDAILVVMVMVMVVVVVVLMICHVSEYLIRRSFSIVMIVVLVVVPVLVAS